MKNLVEFTTALALSVSLLAADTQAALEDRAQFPVAEHPYLYYVTTAASLPAERDALKASTKLVVASTSLQPIIERCVPQEVTPTMMRIDLRDLKWRWQDWHQVLAEYPYAPERLPLVIRADWLIIQLTDLVESDAYLRLLFGGDKLPKTESEWLKLLGVSPTGGADKDLRNFGMVEGQSGVSKAGVRLIENRPVTRGYAWITRDIVSVQQDNDPIAHLKGDFAYDGAELIVGIPKNSNLTGQRGALQVYLLTNGKGKIVDRAPVDLVEDATEFRGLREIRIGSCITCHSRGLNDPTENSLRLLIGSGVDVYADKGSQQEIESFHLSELSKEIQRNKEDFATAVQAVCGMPPENVSFSFKLATEAYDLPVSFDRAAHELSTTPDDLRLALGFYSASTVGTPARVAGLAHGLAMPRDSFAEHFMLLKTAVRNWSQE